MSRTAIAFRRVALEIVGACRGTPIENDCEPVHVDVGIDQLPAAPLGAGTARVGRAGLSDRLRAQAR